MEDYLIITRETPLPSSKSPQLSPNNRVLTSKNITVTMNISFKRGASMNNQRGSKEVGMLRHMLLALLIVAFVGTIAYAQKLTISEIAWAGTASNTSDEWVELFNPTDQPIDVTGWLLTFGDNTIDLGRAVNTAIEPGGYFLLERTDDDTVSDIAADMTYTGGLSNDGVILRLLDDTGELADTANAFLESGWAAGSASKSEVAYATMERIDPAGPDLADNWASNNGLITCGHDTAGKPINGTPRAKNSATILRETAPAVTINVPSEEGQIVSDSLVVSWDSHDPDGNNDALEVDILISTDGGDTFSVLVSDLVGNSYVWDTTKHENGDKYLLKVIAKDPAGYHGQATSPQFAIAN